MTLSNFVSSPLILNINIQTLYPCHPEPLLRAPLSPLSSFSHPVLLPRYLPGPLKHKSPSIPAGASTHTHNLSPSTLHCTPGRPNALCTFTSTYSNPDLGFGSTTCVWSSRLVTRICATIPASTCIAAPPHGCASDLNEFQLRPQLLVYASPSRARSRTVVSEHHAPEVLRSGSQHRAWRVRTDLCSG